MKNQQNQNGRTDDGLKRKRISEGMEEYEDDAGLIRELKRRRAKVEEEMNSLQKLVGKSNTGIAQIGQQLKEGKIKPERVEFKKRIYNDYLRCLPAVRESLDKSKLEFETCSLLILEMESSFEERLRAYDSNSKCAAAATADVAADLNEPTEKISF